MRALVFALAATLVAMLATTDARPVAAEPFARVRSPDPATSTTSDAPRMFPTDGRLWARHADGAWAKGTGRWRDASIAMAEYARVHRAILAASSGQDDASGERARSRPTNAREPRFVVWRGRHLAGCPFPRRLRAAASALALALVTDRAFILDDPVLERLLDLDASDAFPMELKEDPTKIRDDVLEMKLTSGSRKEEGGNDDAPPTLPCGGIAGMRASTSRVHRFIADEAVDWTKALVEDPDGSDKLRRNGLGINAAEVAGTFTTFLLRPRHVPIRLSSEEDVPHAVGDHPASDVRRVSSRRVIGVHVSEDDLEYRRDRAEDEEDAGESEVLGSIPTRANDPAGTLREWTSSCVSTLSGRDEARTRDDRRTRERGGSPSLFSSTLAALFGSRGRNREVTGSNPGRAELDTEPIVVAAFEDNSFSARGAGTVRTWFNERVSRLGFHDEDGKKHKTRSEKESDKAPDEASDEGQLADLLALTAGCDELVVTGPDGDLGGVAAAVFGAVTGRVARKPGDSCVALDLSHDLDLGVGRRGELETAAVLARATGRGVVAARVVNEGGSAVC
jgi:hypothetical protein